MVNTLEYTTRAAWDRIAPGYDKTNTSTQMWLGNEGLRRVELRSGMPKGVREMARVANRHGSVLLHAYGDPHQIDFLGFLIDARCHARAAKERLCKAAS